MDGIKRDNAELVRSALRQEISDPNQRLEDCGPAGAAFSYANAVRTAIMRKKTRYLDQIQILPLSARRPHNNPREKAL